MTADYKRSFTGIVAVLAAALAAVWAPAAGADSSSTFDCVIQPTEFVELSSAVPGIIDTIAVDRSDPVEMGQEVARLKSDVEQAQVDLSKQRAGFDSEIESKRASLSFAQRSQERTQKLFNKKAIPFHVLDEAKTDAILAATELRTAQQNKRMAELELARAQATLALRTVRSPISGVVVERLKAPGEFIENKPIIRIAQLDPLRVEVIVPVGKFGTIKDGMRAEVTPERARKRTYIAQVTIVDKVVDAASGTFGVRLELPNPGNFIPGGLRCSLTFLD
jgi:RND family efflux transporter MFP subunit